MVIPTINAIIVEADALLISYTSLDFNQPRKFYSITPNETMTIVADTGDNPNISICELRKKY